MQVNDKFEVLLGDFGLSRFTTDSNVDTLMKVVGTVAYSAPEVFTGAINVGGFNYTTKCDVYSIAMILWEIMMRTMSGKYQRPYSEYKQLTFDFQILTQASEKKLR